MALPHNAGKAMITLEQLRTEKRAEILQLAGLPAAATFASLAP
jgi:hypothetical protein